jgi:ferrous iron transport protein B
MPEISDYTALHYLINHESFHFGKDMHHRIENIEEVNQFNHTRVQAEEILQRYHRIRQVMQQTISNPIPCKKLFSQKDSIISCFTAFGDM